jgi:hypothetical protein
LLLGVLPSPPRHWSRKSPWNNIVPAPPPLPPRTANSAISIIVSVTSAGWDSLPSSRGLPQGPRKSDLGGIPGDELGEDSYPSTPLYSPLPGSARGKSMFLISPSLSILFITLSPAVVAWACPPPPFWSRVPTSSLPRQSALPRTPHNTKLQTRKNTPHTHTQKTNGPEAPEQESKNHQNH